MAILVGALVKHNFDTDDRDGIFISDKEKKGWKKRNIDFNDGAYQNPPAIFNSSRPVQPESSLSAIMTVLSFKENDMLALGRVLQLSAAPLPIREPSSRIDN